MQSRSVSCVEEDMQGVITPTDEWKCLYSPKTSILQPCNAFDCPVWLAQEWSPVGGCLLISKVSVGKLSAGEERNLLLLVVFFSRWNTGFHFKKRLLFETFTLCLVKLVRRKHLIFGNLTSSNFRTCLTYTSVTRIRSGFAEQINIRPNERGGERHFDGFNCDNYTVLFMFFLIRASKSKHNLVTLFNIKRIIKIVQGLNLRLNSGGTCGSAACCVRWITATADSPSPIFSPSG